MRSLMTATAVGAALLPGTVLATDSSVPFINADQVHELGITGRGVTVAVIDTADLAVLLSVYGLQATGAIRARFTWDAENRLIGWEPLLSVSGARKVEFGYDSLGRRIEKRVYTYNGSSWDLSQTRQFVWNSAAGGSRGRLLLLELDGEGNVLRKLTWGRDLSGLGDSGGSLDGAGGIGGLWRAARLHLGGACRLARGRLGARFAQAEGLPGRRGQRATSPRRS